MRAAISLLVVGLLGMGADLLALWSLHIKRILAITPQLCSGGGASRH